MIREAVSADISSLVDIHMRALPDDLLPRLGHNYLRYEFYPRVLKSSYATTWVVDEDDKLKAIMIVSSSPAQLTAELSRNKFILGVHLLLGALYNLKTLKTILAHLKGFRSEMGEGFECLDLSLACEIYLIATDPVLQSQGLGSQLVVHGLGNLSGKCNQCLVKTSSDDARRFYLRHGFVDVGLEYRGNKPYHILLNSLSKKDN